jgi:hypothetical protein
MMVDRYSCTATLKLKVGTVKRAAPKAAAIDVAAAARCGRPHDVTAPIAAPPSAMHPVTESAQY